MLKQKKLELEDTWFEMSPRQQLHFNNISKKYENLRRNYHALHSALWHSSHEIEVVQREFEPNYPKDACRIHGTLELNKVLGIFHVMAGQMVNFMGQHGHIIEHGMFWLIDLIMIDIILLIKIKSKDKQTFPIE